MAGKRGHPHSGWSLTPHRKSWRPQILCCQWLGVANYSGAIDALSLKPSDFCSNGDKRAMNTKLHGADAYTGSASHVEPSHRVANAVMLSHWTVKNENN